MRLGDGGWNDNRNNRNYRWIVEFNTLDPVIPDDEINNYDLLTTYNGHAYYISKTGARPHWANIYARNTGGYLTFINDAAENEILRSSASTYVHGYDNTSSNTRVWIGIYQNNSSPKFVEKAGGWESYPMPSTVNYQWQISSDSVNWSDITAANNLFLLNDTTITLSNYNTDQLTVSPTINSLNGYKFRVKIFNPAFVCASEVISEETMLIIRSDFDGDGVEDDADVER